MAGFIVNSFGTFYKYFSKATLVLSWTESHHSWLPLPVFLICNQSAFKNPHHVSSPWQMEEYTRQTRDPSEILHQVSIFSPLNHSRQEYPADYKASELNTAFQGRCVSIQLEEKVGYSLEGKIRLRPG